VADINIHVGAHGILPRYLEIAIKTERRNLRKRQIVLISPSQYRLQLRKAVQETLINEALNSKILQEMSRHERQEDLFVLSRHNLLCSDGSIFRGRKLYAAGASRVQNLVSIFSGHELHFNIVISDAATWARVLAENEMCPLPNNPMLTAPDKYSWYETIARLFDGLDPAMIRVWAAPRFPSDEAEIAQLFFSPGSSAIRFSEDTLKQALETDDMLKYRASIPEAMSQVAAEVFMIDIENIKDKLGIDVRPLT
jgi:hypothetical protein